MIVLWTCPNCGDSNHSDLKLVSANCKEDKFPVVKEGNCLTDYCTGCGREYSVTVDLVVTVEEV